MTRSLKPNFRPLRRIMPRLEGWAIRAALNGGWSCLQSQFLSGHVLSKTLPHSTKRYGSEIWYLQTYKLYGSIWYVTQS